MKRVFHHINRTLLRCLEVAGVLALVVLIAWLGLLWRLSQGPLDVSPWVTEKMEDAFGRDIDGFVFKLGGAQLTWGGRFEPFEFEMRDVKIERSDKTPVLDVKKLNVQLSKRNLVFGRIVPRLIRVQGPALRVIRKEDGGFTLNVGAETKEDVEPPPVDAPVEQNRQELVKGVLGLLQERSGLGLLDGLREVTVSDAALLYEDRVLGVRWLTKNADVSVVRGDTGISATSLVTVDMDETKKATVRAEVKYDWETQHTEATAAFTGLIPSKVAQASESLKPLSDINMTFSGSLSFGLDADFKPALGRFALGADAGTFNAFGLYKEPVAVKGLYASGKLDAQAGRAEISELKIDLGGPQAVASVKIETEEGGIRVGTVKGTLANLPMDWVKIYWPDSLTPDPRWWVTSHLSQGTATKATIDAALAYDANAEHKISLRKLGGKIDFTGVKVDYFPPLMPVMDVAGSAIYDHSSFHITSTGGKIQDMKMTKGKVVITDLDKIKDGGVSKIDITASVTGPMKTALKLLDSKPLEYPAMLGLKSEGVGGTAETEVSIKFPIRKALALKDIKIRAEAKLHDVLLKDVVAGMDLTGGPMELDVDNERIKVKGKGKLGSMPADFDWLKNFSKEAEVASRLTASLPLDTASLSKFGLPEMFKASGSMPSTVEYTLKQDKSAVLALKGDVKGLGFTVPMIGFSKAEGVDGMIALTLALQDNHPQRITGLDLSGGGINVKGDIDFTRDGMGAVVIKKANIKQFLMGDTDIAVEAEPFGKDGYSLKVTGRQIDASPLFKPDATPSSDEEAAKQAPPVRLSLNINRMITGPNHTVEKVKVMMLRNQWKRIDQLELDAVAGKPVTLRYIPGPKGHTLKFEALDAGAALLAFGLTKKEAVKGGVLRIDGRPRVGGGMRDMVGTAALNDFKLKDAPVILSILKLVSIVGIPELMSQSGVAFTKARVDFAWADKGQPEQHDNVRMLTLKDGRTFGSSLGITFEGNIDNWKNVYDLEGTIVPASNVSKLLNIIPIVGTVLTANGEGIFAATYKVKGAKENPQISANPLSVLAPGILRKMFFR